MRVLRYPIIPAVALCDGRRWEMNGVLKNTLLNQYFVWLYVCARAPACVCTCVRVHVRVYICMHVHMHACTR